MKISEKINLLHHNIQEVENNPALLDDIFYHLAYDILEQAREILEKEGN